MKRVAQALVCAALLAATASVADAAPMPDSGPGGTHPSFPQLCTGGPFGAEQVFGWVTVANGTAFGKGTLPTGFFYEGGTLETPPDYDSVDPVVGVAMYRVTVEIDPAGNVVSAVGQGRTSQNGKLDIGNEAIEIGIAETTAKWDVAFCSITLPGFLLGEGYNPDNFYNFTNLVK
jgi:hypothetical protein